MKRVGILLVLAILLLSGCAAGGVGKETVSTAAPEMKEKLESAEASENKRVRVSDPVNEEVNDKVADSDESTMESTASDSNQLTEQDQQQLKSDLESDTSVVSSQIVDSYSSEARESDEESADRSTEEHPDMDSLESDQTDDDMVEINHQMLKSPEVVSGAIEVLQKIITDGDLDEEPMEKQRCQGLIEELKTLYAEERRQQKRQAERSAR